MTTESAPSTLGWTVTEWLRFHFEATPGHSLDLLLKLLRSQQVAPQDPAWISIATEQDVRKQWRLLQTRAEKESLPLYGVPIAIKDNIDAQGFPTTAACPAFAYEPETDSRVVELLRLAGAIIIGKTNLDQFATGLVGTRSPYGATPSVFSDKHVSGGSSAGSASVVGRGIVPLALGTDTAGSGRVPAALNNLIGLKPTKGVFSCRGVVPACKSLDCVSIFALNLSDAERCFEILCRSDRDNDEYSRVYPSNPLQRFAKNLTIAIPQEVPWYGEEENPKLFTAAVQFLANTGARIITIDFDPFLELARCLYEGAWVAERYNACRDFYSGEIPKSSLDPVVTEIIKGGARFDAADAFKYEYKRQGIMQKISKLMKDIDVLCVPTCPLNPTFEEVAKEPILVNSIQGTWTNFVNLADLAALAVPAGFRNDGLPNGITLIGKAFTDYALLDLAKRYFKEAFPGGSRSYGSLGNRSVRTGDDNLKGAPFDEGQSIKLAVVGAHLKGLPLHWQLEKVNAKYIASPKTSRRYRLYALPKTGPVLKPGLRRVDDKIGSEIQLELYSVPLERFGEFMAMVPEPLGIGSVELESGEWVKSFICEEWAYKATGAIDITSCGGFKSYVEQLAAKESNSKTYFGAVLIANRGEIAVRIIKTLKKMKIKSVAVYSDPDRYSRHVLEADISIPLHGNSSAETYLNVEKIINAVRESGAQAVIPGYGFLSENADFVDRLHDEGIIFIGPSGDVIRRLGLKHSAREIARAAGVPLVPGSPLLKTFVEAKEYANKIEYPIMLKSTAGGGGIGLQRVDSESDIERVFETVQHQGESYFGDSGVFLERFVERARHVEVQIIGDGRGNAITLGERDCSLQRRNQKIIEETPAPNFPEHTRQKIKDSAAKLAKALKYKCAGTVEFIYDESRDEYYFLEVNTRLQVEHPITEMVTGIDLIEWMIKIAADDPPKFAVPHIKTEGASIEARLYAENPLKDFRPSPGELTHVEFPEWARVDTWIKKGDIVTAEYDPTLAKIIVHGKDRNDAILKLNRALMETKVYGCITNLDYLKSLSSSKMFMEGKVSTNLLNTYKYRPQAIEIVSPGAHTTVQDYPGRVGYWGIGVPPSGPMDCYSFRLANRIVGNTDNAPALEITLSGPTIIFHTEAVISITGGSVISTIDGMKVDQNTPIEVREGSKLEIGKITRGCRAYLAIRGCIDVAEYLGSRSTFTLGNMGGYNGRVLKLGDVLFMADHTGSNIPSPAFAPQTPPASLIPAIEENLWTIGVTCGPHGSPDIFTSESIDDFFSEQWKVHYNSNRFGVRLIGPKPKWAKQDGGEGGMHPSNTNDYVYSLGAINFTGDEPVIVTCDGPSLGGFVCQAVVPEGELWKVGQLRPGDLIKFVPISYKSARIIKESQDRAIESLEDGTLEVLNQSLLLSNYENPILAELKPKFAYKPRVVYRQAGDRYILVEYGDGKMDFNMSYRINRLKYQITKHKTKGIREMAQGVTSVLVEFDSYQITQKELLDTLMSFEDLIRFSKNWSVKSNIIRLPMAFEDQKTLKCVERYQETIRSKAPWLPNNVDFIANVNGISRADVQSMVYSARFMVLGLGDVYLGSPCAVPLDPRQRFLGAKYNPSRSYTEKGVVGLGGMYMCIYAASSPGGYQLLGRTIPIWDKLQLLPHSKNPWLLSPFDQIEFYPVSEEELDSLTEDFEHGNYELSTEESVFDHKKYLEWIQNNSESIEKHQQIQSGERLKNFKSLIKVANSELETVKVVKNAEKEFPHDSAMVYSEYSGRFWKPMVKVGDKVDEGQGLVIIEAMKTEMIVSSPKSGIVKYINYQNGDMVEAGDVVAVVL